MRVVRFAGLLLAVSIAGCGGVKPVPPGEAPKSSAAPAATAAPSVPPAAPAPSAATPGAPAAPQAAQASAAPKAPAGTETIAKAAPPGAKAAPKAPSAPAPAAQPPKKEAAPAQAAPLDLNSLETRLKDTKAIGVMTKIALKNQVDDLLNQFRAFYQGKLKTTLAELRKPYDLLVLKVLSLLQDSDPSLAAAIVASREAIWGILSDPAKFAAAI